MLTFHASMPAFSPAALRRIELSWYLLQAVLGGAAAWVFGRGGVLPAMFYMGCILTTHLAAEVALRHWARRRALPFTPRRDWRTAWRNATYAAPVLFVLARALLFGLAIAQLAQGRLAWNLNPQGWVAVAVGTVVMFLAGPWNRGSAAADAWAAAHREATPGPGRDAP